MDKRKCVWCGKEFQPRSPRQTSCKDDHYRPCAICGEPLLVKESYQNYMKYGPRTCSRCRGIKISNAQKNMSEEAKAARLQKTKATMLERYGYENPANVPEIAERRKATVREKYGVDNLSQSSLIQQRIKENSLKKYGTEHPAQALENREKMRQGMINKYGVANPLQCAESRAKMEATNLERYGTRCVLSNKDIQAKIKHTCIDKYGVLYAAQAPEVIERRIRTNMSKYGAPGYVFSDEFLMSQMTDPSKHAECEAFRKNPKEYLVNNYLSKPTYAQLSKDLGISETSVSSHIVKNGLQDNVQYSLSNMENEVCEFLTTICPNISIQRHSRSICSPKEVDIFLPDHELGIECNPTYTHNSSFADPWGDAIKPPSYHKHKTDRCEQAGVFLFHIFGYEWTYRKDIIKSMIANLISRSSRKVYGRNTEIVELSHSECSRFLELNHRQGPVSSSIRLGLKCKETDEIISAMCFTKMRSTMGASKHDDDETYELVRFCNKLNTNVVGGASKLFKHFLVNYNPSKVVSFSDRAHTKGNLYVTLGFEKVSISDPSYVWVNLKDNTYYHRVTCQKHNLVNLFTDVTEDTIQQKTEKAIMMEHGYAQVFDSGVIRWEYTKK